jgi:ribosomal protein S16
MINLKYRSLKIKLLRMGRKRQWFYYIWLYNNKKKFKLIGRYFPHHFRVEGQFIKVCIINNLALGHYLRKGAVCNPKIAKLFQGLL